MSVPAPRCVSRRWQPIVPCVAVLLATVALPLCAQQRDTTRVQLLDSIVVTGEPVQAAPPPVTTLTAAAPVLRATQGTSPWDMVRRATGIEVHEQGQGPGFASNVVLRGFSSDHSADVLLAIDGVPINLPIHGHVEGYNDWSLLSAASVGSLRVLHGPASPLYGDFNFGGVVEVFTPSDAGGPAAALAGSSFGDVNGWFRTGGRAARGGFFVAGRAEYANGWRPNSEAVLGNATLRGWRQVGRGRLEGGLLLYGSGWNSPGFLSVAQFNADDLRVAIDTSDGGDAQRAIATARYATPLGDGPALDVSGWVQGVRTHVYLNIPEDGVQRQQEELDRRVALGTQARLVWDGRAGEFTAGVAGRFDDSQYDRYNTTQRVRDDAEILNDGQFLSGAAFGRWRRLVASQLALDLGLRLDVQQYASLDRRAASATRQTATAAQLSPKLGARWFLNGNTALLASVSRGFRGAPGVVTDPSLPPLSVWGGEVGAQWTVGGLHLEGALFRLDVRNERIQDPISLEVVSTGGSYRQGVNLRAAWQVGRVALEADGTWNVARIKGEPGDGGAGASRLSLQGDGIVQVPFRPMAHLEPPRPGDPVPGVAQYNGRVGGTVRVGSRSMVGARVRVGGPFTPLGEPNTLTQPYALLDLEGSIPLGRGGTMLDIMFQNVFSTRYPEIRAAGFVNPGAPAVVRVAVRYDLAQ